jgi:hypothetical protein
MKRMIHRCYSSCYHPCSDGLMIFNHSLAMVQESKRWLFVGSRLGHRFACPFGQSPGRPGMPWPPPNPIMIIISILFPIQTWQKFGGKCHEIWVNYNDLTATSLKSWLIREFIPKWP